MKGVIKMAGRKPVFSSQARGNFTKKELEIKKKAEKELGKLEAVQVSAPSYLSSKARGEWNRMQKLVGQLPIGEIDRTVLESYCEAYATFRLSSEDINERGHFVINSKGERVPNPAIRVRNNAVSEMRATLTTLGLTVTERLKMAIEVAKEAEKESFNLGEL